MSRIPHKMNNIKFLVLSDIHLEKVGEIKQRFLLSSINERIDSLKNKGFEPVVVFAGDVNNSTKGYSFISQIKTHCIYVAGNHEFWNCDYYETINRLKFESPSNVEFLHNDITSVGEYLIIGTTLWTDIGQSLNKDILRFAGSRMNDMSYISAKEWYEDSSNIDRLKEVYLPYEVNAKIESKNWNMLIELDENQKSWNFINNTGSILSAVNKAKLINNRLDADLYSKYSFSKINEEVYKEIKIKIDFTKENLTWEQFIENLATIQESYRISEEEKNNFLKNEEKKNILFQKIRKIDNVENKKIVMLSHHLPFYEEVLVGSIMKEHYRGEVRLFNETDANIFLVRSGVNYPEPDYLNRAKKGEIERTKDITHIVNYYNNGTTQLGSFLLENTSLWIHGHEHHFRYCDYVKGIQIITNPSGSALSLLDSSSDVIKPNQHYLSYYKISNENEILKEVTKIKEGLVTESGEFLSKEELEGAVKLWSLKTFNWQEYIDCLKKLDNAAKEILLLSIEYIEQEGSKNILSEIEEQAYIWMDSYNYNCEKIKKIHEDLILACSVRLDRDFSFQSYKTNSLTTFRDIHSWTMGNASPPQPIKNGVFGMFSAKASFEAKGNIKIALKYAERVQEFLNSTNFQHVHHVKKEDIDIFEKLSENAISKWKVAQKLEEKWNIFYGKTFEKELIKRNSKLDF